VSDNEKEWKSWCDTEAPEEEEIPCGYNNALDVFRKLLLIRAWYLTKKRPFMTVPNCTFFLKVPRQNTFPS